MSARQMITIDGNEAASSVAYRVSEVAAIYPITPSSPMGENADEWAVKGLKNIWGNTVSIMEMQSEGGASGAVHGAVQGGALATTFTASQGLLLMIPNMYKIAGELTPFCMHVSARTLATHALSIFGDHSDVMCVRQTGFALLASGSVQEAHDLALVAHASTLKTRVPFLHFFDGFRTSHEVAKMELLEDDDLRHMIDEEAIKAHRNRALTPDRPVIRGTAQNPDAFFQAREACNKIYDACPEIVQQEMEKFGARIGRKYNLFDYFGPADAERVIIVMGSGAETVRETVDYLVGQGEKVGVVVVRLYRPFSAKHFLGALPKTTKSIAVLDRTKEPGACGEPLYQDVLTSLQHAVEDGTLPFAMPKVIGGRYGLSSKEFTPAMVKAVFDELTADAPRRLFTVGIMDDVTHLSLDYDAEFDIEPDDVVRAMFYGLGADGTVGANKNSIKIIGEETENYAQGYFVYDSKKSGAITISHLRFGPRPIQSTYLIRKANFVGCHQFVFMDKYDVLECATPGAVFLLNAPYGPEEVFDHLPKEAQEQIIEKKLKFYVINANTVAREAGMGGRINTIMQTCFFAVSGVLPREEAIDQIKQAIKKTYAKKGDEVVKRNWDAVDAAIGNMHEVAIPGQATSERCRPPIVSDKAPDFVKRVTSVMMANKGDLLPVSAFPVDGTWPTATTQWEKRSVALDIPVWDSSVCIQCNKCAMVCPHGCIRAKVYDAESMNGTPDSFQCLDYKAKEFKGKKFTIQVSPDDCTGCRLCVEVCPAKNKENPRRKATNMESILEAGDRERANWDCFTKLPHVDRTSLTRIDVKQTQFLRPLFEYSGACAGCGETPYVKLMSQLYGDRALISNATGCSS
ncbi:MAG: pyruvate:ferredoxin (flavodoxin) oxidoreductase, partial [Phycisphaerales bacterium JB038]